MAKKRKTRKEKIKASLRSKVQVENRIQHNFQYKTEEKEISIGNRIQKTKEKEEEKEILSVPAILIRKDLQRTLFLSIIILIFILVLYIFMQKSDGALLFKF